MSTRTWFVILTAGIWLASCGPPAPPPGSGAGDSKPNLVVDASWKPAQFVAGQDVTVYWSIRNIGKGNAQPRPAYSVITTGQASVHGAPGNPATVLAAGGSTPTRKFVWTAQCSDIVRIVADPANDIMEANEGDNVWQKKFEYPVCLTSSNKPDLAIIELTLKVLKKTSKTTGQVEINGVAMNLGGATLKNSGWVELCKAETAKSYHCMTLKKETFQGNVIKSGDQLKITMSQAFSVDCSDLSNSPVFKAFINYYEAYPKQNIYEIDINTVNNSMEKNSKTICEQLK
jgi:hypothetical protein